MSVVHRVLHVFRDSPTFGRDRANLISGLSVGTTALLLNAAVMLLLLPLMLLPDDRDFRFLTQNVEFGQLLGLILLGGATVFATLLIPMRLLTVLMGPRIGRYFDQVVLSGITPLRFLIGKATSQNLFLGLILFLLIPWLVLILSVGGVSWPTFLASVFIVWLYCMALAFVMLWMSLYMNEVLAAWFLIAGTLFLSVIGSLPIPWQPFVITPFPVLMHTVYASFPYFDGWMTQSFSTVFVSSVVCMSSVIIVALIGIAIGPLYGIIRENSTFGEVVRTGDSKRRRWFRLRLHIQRPSEIAFFYENRGAAFRRWEGLLRWGFPLCVLLLLSATASAVLMLASYEYEIVQGGGGSWWVYDFHATNLAIHGVGVVLAVFLFSHAQNTTYLRLPVFAGRRVRVSHLDTAAFLVFLTFSTAVALGMPFLFDHSYASQAGISMFPSQMFGNEGREIDYVRVVIEGTAVLTMAGLTVYLIQRFLCLTMWLKSAAFFATAGFYFFVLCLGPLLTAVLILEAFELRTVPFFRDLGHVLALTSPMSGVVFLFRELGSDFPPESNLTACYVVHVVVILAILAGIRRVGGKVRQRYWIAGGEESL